MRRYVLLLVLLVLFASLLIIVIGEIEKLPRERAFPGPAAESREKAIEEVVELVGPAVVAINTEEVSRTWPSPAAPFYRFFAPGVERTIIKKEGLGSGVIFSREGYILTSEHVVGGARRIRVRFSDGRQSEASLFGRDPSRDVALLKLPEGGFPIAALGDSDGLSVGQVVLAFGNPFGTASRSAQPSVTLGVVSALHRNLELSGGKLYRDLIQTDAAINVGNNGGPLVDLGGQVVGMNTLIITSGGASTGVGFAIPINLVRESIERLLRRGERRTAG